MPFNKETELCTAVLLFIPSRKVPATFHPSRGGCVFFQTSSGGGCTAENLMIFVCLNGQDLSAPTSPTETTFFFCFARMLSLGNRALMDVAAVTCVTEQLLFTAVCWELTKKIKN